MFKEYAIKYGIQLVIIAIAWLAGKYGKSWIHENEKRAEMARKIALVADEVTDDLVKNFPNASWDDILNSAVDKIITALGIESDVAKRAATTKLLEKKNR